MSTANGNPPPTSPSDSFAMQCQYDGYLPVAVKKVTTPAAGGSGSDVGGGDSSCPEYDAPVEIQRYSEQSELIFQGEVKAGVVLAGFESDDGTIRRGDFIKGYSFAQQRDVFRAVQRKRLLPCAGWMVIDGWRYTACEQVWDEGAWKPAYKVSGALLSNQVGVKVDIEVEADWDDEHNYYAGKRLIHNSYILPC